MNSAFTRDWGLPLSGGSLHYRPSRLRHRQSYAVKNSAFTQTEFPLQARARAAAEAELQAQAEVAANEREALRLQAVQALKKFLGQLGVHGVEPTYERVTVEGMTFHFRTGYSLAGIHMEQIGIVDACPSCGQERFYELDDSDPLTSVGRWILGERTHECPPTNHKAARNVRSFLRGLALTRPF